MYKRVKIKKLGRTESHRKALIQNQLRSLVRSGSIKTTTPKAKVIKGEIESLFVKVRTTKEGDLTLRRELQSILGDSELVKKFINASSVGGSVTLRKIGFRSGDNAEVSLLEVKELKAKKKIAKKEKVDNKEEVSNTPVQKEEKKNILNLGKKSVSKTATPIKKERARTRSGL